MRYFCLFAVLPLLLLVHAACGTATTSTPSRLGPTQCIVHFWVAPDGSDSSAGTQEDPFQTLEFVRDFIRAHDLLRNCRIQVNVGGGTYRLTSTLVYEPQDSGAEGNEVVYLAVVGETPVISGGIQVTGWTLVDALFNIWAAPVTVSTATMPRQLYVNGVRATRARTAEFPDFYTPGADGYTYVNFSTIDLINPSTWTNPTEVEAVTATQWKMMRCRVGTAEVDPLVPELAELKMIDPCWSNANVYPPPWNFHLLSWWENTFEFLDEAGEWYLDSADQMLYYIPLEGEDMATADVELPILEMLIDAQGTETEAVSFLYFEGLTFAHATWLRPNTSDGYVCDQSGFHILGEGHTAARDIVGHDPDVVRMPGNISFVYAQNIGFVKNTFEHLGAVALDFGTGSQDNEIFDNTFNDISGTGIQLGGVQERDHHPSLDSQITRDNLISNNLIEFTGRDFYDTPGIYLGFTTRSIVEHNRINQVPWAGMAIGWGWGLLDQGSFPGLPNATEATRTLWGIYDTPSTSMGNQIIHNHFTNFLEKLWDAGAIYTQGFQGTSLENGMLMAWNVAEDKRRNAGGNTYYTDGGSRYVTVRENVSLNNEPGFFDFGPCGLSSSFPLILCAVTNLVNYGEDMGGCVTYGDVVLEKNYLLNKWDYFNICAEHNLFPGFPVNMSFINNVAVTTRSEVPSWILEQAGRQ